MMIVDGTTKFWMFLAAKYSDNEINWEEEAGPTRAKPTTEEWSNKLKNKA